MEWFTNNAPATIAACSALLAAFIASISTLIGIKFNNKQSFKIRQEQAMLERWKSNRELYINKGEEIFTLFNEWHGMVANLTLLHIMNVVGHKTSQQVQSETSGIVNASVQPRIQVLLSLYFNEPLGNFEVMNNLHGKMILQYSNFIASKNDVSETAISLQALLTEFNLESTKFKLQLSNEIKSYI